METETTDQIRARQDAKMARLGQNMADASNVYAEASQSWVSSPLVKLVPPLDEQDVKVLNYLNDKSPQVRFQTDIESVTGLTRKTIGQVILLRLKEYGLVGSPDGRKNGVVITPAGRKYISELLS